MYNAEPISMKALKRGLSQKYSFRGVLLAFYFTVDLILSDSFLNITVQGSYHKKAEEDANFSFNKDGTFFPFFCRTNSAQEKYLLNFTLCK
jgi:hypothetical protein